MMKQIRLLLFIFILWKSFDTVTAYIVHIFDNYHEHFTYGFQLSHYDPYIPPFLLSFANYDGANYLHIAHEGYGMYMQAYFPLFPLLIHIFSPLFGNGFFLAGFFIANLSFFLGLYFFKKYLEAIGKKKRTIYWIILLLLVYPLSFFFGAVYTEGLFFLLVTAVLYFSQKKQYTLVIILSVLASLTRLMGVFLFIPLFTAFVLEQQKFHLKGKPIKERLIQFLWLIRKNWKMVIISMSPMLGLFCYLVYLYITAHDPFYFYHAVSSFHTGRTTSHLIFLPQVYYRYFAIFLKASHTFTYYIAILEFIIFNLFFWILLFDLWQLWKNKKKEARMSLLGLNLFSLVNLILPTLTGTMTSIPRYALFSLSFFLWIAEIRKLWIKVLLLCLFILFHIILLSLFVQGYFIS